MTPAIRTANLGQGWFASENEDGSYTLRNGDKGLRIDLSVTSARLFAEMYDESETRDAPAHA